MIILSEDNNNSNSPDIGTVVLEKDPQVKEPPSYQVVLINDDWISKTAFFKKIETFINPIDVQTPFINEMKKWANYLKFYLLQVKKPNLI